MNLFRPVLFAIGVSAVLLVSASSVRAATIVLTGAIAGVGSNFFSLNSGSSCGYVPIFSNASTQLISNGLTISRGVYAKVTGSGNCRSVLAAQIILASTPFGQAPQHILTADYLFSLHNRPAAAYAPWLTWSETNTANANAIAAVGIKTLFYTNPNRERPTDPLYNTNETTFAHTCSGSRITNSGSTSPFLMDPNSTSLTQLWAALVKSTNSQAHFDVVFDDNADDVYGTSALPCNYDPQKWLTATQNQIRNLRYPVVYNALGVLGNSNNVSPTIALNLVSLGGMMESCYDSVFHPHALYGLQWIIVENTEIAMANQRKLFFCYASYTAPASTSTVYRLYVDASFLLSYDINTSVLWEYFPTPSGFHVEPESALVALSPLVPEPNDVSVLKKPGGAYGREYAACYLASVYVGLCAAAVNPDKNLSSPFPFSGYTRTLVVAGAGILDGGTATPTGPAPALIAPQSGVIAFK